MKLQRFPSWLKAVTCGLLLLFLHVQGETPSVSTEDQGQGRPDLQSGQLVLQEGRKPTRDGR